MLFNTVYCESASGCELRKFVHFHSKSVRKSKLVPLKDFEVGPEQIDAHSGQSIKAGSEENLIRAH